MSHIIYLETFIENTASLPSELARIMNNIKALDERSAAMRDTIAENLEIFLSRPLGPRKAGSELPSEMVDLKRVIDEDQRTYVQWAEEKLSLANIAADLLIQHRTAVDKDVGALLAELKAADYDDDTVMEYTPPEETNRRQRQREIEAEREREQKMKAELRRQERELAEMEQQRNAEAAAAQAAAQAEAATAAEPQGEPPLRQKGPPTGKGNRKEQEMAITPTAVDTGVPKRKSSGAGGAHMPLQMNLSGRISPMDAMASTPSQFRGLGNLPGILSQPMPMETDRSGEDEEPREPTYMPIVPAGMSTSAPAPQALGRLLTMEDISKDLKGRRAELWWPDDSLWYLIEIHDVDIPLKKAHITYVTGETEVLDLLDIVREGHMSLISGENHRVPY
ncbi:hypothetical protein CVIRNUC_008082 [Coccomyxa viridis]|uniref:Inhibitor of growth protein N-terminal histone-binding domain-containing protein n=1 Tax=Coccomyxa viridis TaxID=1274662 RepID=A0AAV1ICL7_9CHLO|nr:hypothetical protein CVIRNUC_008082 [Coccomyxa viridis]